jgi:prophage DNA circulation protein
MVYVPPAAGDAADEVLAIVRRIGPVVLSSAVNPRGDVGTALRRMVGMLIADKNMADIGVFAFSFALCLDLARQSEATLVTMDRVRKAALKEVPKSLPATQTVLAIVRLTLATEARIIAFMEFKSRQEVGEIATAMNAAFTQTSEIAADDLDQGTYMALISLHGDVVQHLAARGRLLPRLIGYNYAMVMPALRMAQRVYADPIRYQELIDENHVVHPAFMPMAGKMLAV